MNSIIIPTFCPAREVRGYLSHCLDCISQNTEMPYELIVVENGSRDIDVIDNIAKPNVFVHTDRPLGYATAVNLGVQLSQGDYLLIVNNDVFVPKGWDMKLVSMYANTYMEIGLLSPMDNPKRTSVWCPKESWWSCVCISRKVWDKVGPLDQNKLNKRLHDQDWSMRASSMGYQVGRTGTVQVQHVNEATYRYEAKDNEQAERAEMRSRWGFEHFCDWVGSRP